VVGAFVGQQDSMSLPQIDALLGALGASVAPGASTLADVAAMPDEKIVDVLKSRGLGAQQIASHVMRNGLSSSTMPLAASFALLGQRYVIDSHVLSNVVHDRVVGHEHKRMMPSPLDVAFGALGNDQAAQLLLPELRRYGYAPNLHMVGWLGDEHAASKGEKSLYDRWIAAIRALSPKEAMASREGLPQVARTEAWGRRLMGTQLASWAELRHNTVLYAKQSYAAGVSCDFPAGYVDPYPKFFDHIALLGEQGAGLVAKLDMGTNHTTGPAIVAYFTHLRDAARTLGAIARQERAGQPLTSDQLAFINRAVKTTYEPSGCTSTLTGVSGWYADLFYAPLKSLDHEPTIADVHTQPFDELGASVGRVLHVGTGSPRLMVVTVEACDQPAAYVGLASSYYEHITGGFERLTDSEWAGKVGQDPLDEPAWTRAEGSPAKAR
jgi:hypothetical protein